MEKVWTWDGLITEYIIQKTRRGYDTNCTFEEIVDFLDFITYFVTVSNPDTKYDVALNNYLSGLGSKSKRWSISKEEFVYVAEVEQLESGLIVPTYNLISTPPEYRGFDDAKKAYDENFNSYLTKYMEKNCSKRKIATEELLDDNDVQFGERAAASLLMKVWNRWKNHYQENGEWPIQCNDIKKHLLDRDLSSIIELPAMRAKLIDFYFNVSKRIMQLSRNSCNFRMTNFEDEVLAKSNFDLVMSGFTDYPYYETTNKRREGIIIDRSKNELQNCYDYYEGIIKKDKLDNPEVLTIVKELKRTKAN